MMTYRERLENVREEMQLIRSIELRFKNYPKSNFNLDTRVLDVNGWSNKSRVARKVKSSNIEVTVKREIGDFGYLMTV